LFRDQQHHHSLIDDICSNYWCLGVVELDGSFVILNSLSAKKKDTIIE